MADEPTIITEIPAETPAPTPAPETPKAEDIATSLLSALEARTQRAERSVARSFSEQYGMTEKEINAILAKAKADKDAQLPEAAQNAIKEQTEKANKKLITAEVKSIGASMGLLDADTALLLMKRDGVTVDDDGNVSGVKEALEALETEKAYLFNKTPSAPAAGVRVDTGASLAGAKAYSSKDDIMAIKDPDERQRAIAENIHLFRKD